MAIKYVKAPPKFTQYNYICMYSPDILTKKISSDLFRRRSQKNEIKSLQLSDTGGSIGREGDHDVLLSDEPGCSKVHARSVLLGLSTYTVIFVSPDAEQQATHI
jgi:hypothetical protein